jgi:aldehyde:ferredoxin oxidoreductase
VWRKGLLPEAEKFGLCFGRPEGILATIPAIAARTGLGALLAEGSKRAALEIGGDSSDWAMHVKGLSCPGTSHGV